MIVLFFGALALWGLSKVGDYVDPKGPGRPSSQPCVIEHNGKYWDGYRFTKSKKEALRFPNHRKAFEYADDTFSEAVAEDCGVENI